MLKRPRLVLALLMAAASVGITVATATPASACTGDPCDGFCYTWTTLPHTLSPKLGGSDCPLR